MPGVTRLYRGLRKGCRDRGLIIGSCVLILVLLIFLTSVKVVYYIVYTQNMEMLFNQENFVRREMYN